MEPDRLKNLLEKYWQAETDEAEESELKEYFAGKPGFEDHPAGALFSYFKEEQKVTIADDFNERFESSMSRETYPMKWLNLLLKVAAVLLIVFSITYILLPGRKSTPIVQKDNDTYDDPEKAYLETKKALLLISHHLNNGNKYITEIGKLNKAEQLINSKEDKK